MSGKTEQPEGLYRQIEETSHSQTLVLMGDFYYPGIRWRDNRAGHKQSKERFLECVDVNFLLCMTEEPMRRGAMLDFFLTNKEGLVRNVKVKGSLGRSVHEIVEFKNLRASEEGTEQSQNPGLQERLQGPAW